MNDEDRKFLMLDVRQGIDRLDSLTRHLMSRSIDDEMLRSIAIEPITALHQARVALQVLDQRIRPFTK